MIVLLLMSLLITKHLILDFFYQPPYQWKNKGTYGHWGGLVHAGQHGIGTWLIMVFFTSPIFAFGLAVFETVIHYHMDWFKMWYGKKKGWTPTTHNEWFVFLGIDQYVHYMTYIVVILFALTFYS